MDAITVSTSLLHPATAYALTTWGVDYVFGHPAYWKRKGVRTDVGMDACNRWGSRVDDAKQAFWEHVADVVVWPAASVYWDEFQSASKIGARERAEKEAGHINLFS